MKNLIVGMGQVGRALHWVMQPDVIGIDIQHKELPKKVDFVHICIPWIDDSDEFDWMVQKYKFAYEDAVIVIHSTVVPGTSERLGVNYSPIRGKHPRLVNDIMKHIKFVAGPDAWKIIALFRDMGVSCERVDSRTTLEKVKLWNTRWFFMQVVFAQSVVRSGVDTEVMRMFMGTTLNVPRSLLSYAARVGVNDHCLIPNEMIQDDEWSKWLLEMNARYEGDRVDC